MALIRMSTKTMLIVALVVALGVSVGAYAFYRWREVKLRELGVTPSSGGAATNPPPPTALFNLPGTGLYKTYFESGGERIKAIVYIPKRWNRAYVILIHGLNSRKEKWVKEGVMKELADAGFCCIAFDLPLHGERGRLQSLAQLPDVILNGSQNIVDLTDIIRSSGVTEIYAIGRSLGSIVLSVALGRGAHIKKAELLLASANFTYLYYHSAIAQDPRARSELQTWVQTKIARQIDPLYALPNYRGAAHLHCGTQDRILPPQSCVYAYDALTSASEKKLFWHNVGHRMPKELFLKEAIEFFKGTSSP